MAELEGFYEILEHHWPLDGELADDSQQDEDESVVEDAYQVPPAEALPEVEPALPPVEAPMRRAVSSVCLDSTLSQQVQDRINILKTFTGLAGFIHFFEVPWFHVLAKL